MKLNYKIFIRIDTAERLRFRPSLHLCVCSLRFIPEIKADGPTASGVKWDGDLAGNLVATYAREGSQSAHEEQATWYRCFARLSSEKSEARIGLQQLNFGPGKILRSLQWFDQIDPRDPTQFTLGVYGALFRQYFDNNANIWVWTLLDNDKPVGPIPQTAQRSKPEYGGRIQIPLFHGEVGLSTHQRQIRPIAMFVPPTIAPPPPLDSAVYENRLGIDGIWDIGVGAWFEASFSHFTPNPIIADNDTAVTMGSDYTFNIGNGLYLSAEAVYRRSSAYALAKANEGWLTAIGPTYPLTSLDQIRLVAIASLEGEGGNYFVDWLRKYDNLLVDVGLFYNEIYLGTSPAMAPPIPLEAQSGVQFLVQYNY